MSWKHIKDDREKYAAYLCSREWAVKRESVRERSGGLCERCRVLPMDATHHLTYERKYDERLEDLQAICNPCHAFTHGKDDFDPVEHSKWIDYLVECKRLGRQPVPEELVRDGLSKWLISQDDSCRGSFIVLLTVKRFSETFQIMEGFEDDTDLGKPVQDECSALLNSHDKANGVSSGLWLWLGGPKINPQWYQTSLKICGLDGPNG